MRRMPTLVEDTLVALFLTAVVLGHAMYFYSDGLPSLLWRL